MRAGPPKISHGTLQTLNGGNIKLGSTTKKYNGTHRWQRWAGEGTDWIKLLAQQLHPKDDVIRSFFASMREEGK